jgi:hypothetical protein
MRHLITILVFLTLSINLLGQQKRLSGANNVSVKQIVSKITVDKNFIDTFTFIKQWDYPSGIFKDESSGEFSTDGTPLDTTHLFFTANCITNVQGGYNIRYCYASKNKSKITLTFSDGLPAYASEFYVYMDKANFSCDVETIYPEIIQGQKKYCKIIKQNLILDKSKYLKGETIKGFIEIEFTETVVMANKNPQKRNLFLRGNFKTKIL